MLRRIASSLEYRAKWARFGVFYARRPNTDRIKVGGRSVRVDFPEAERSRQEHEFHKILLDDCYRLNAVPNASTVLDIGANIGLFALAARKKFPRSVIHCYEPNPAVLPSLNSHAQQIDAICFPEAVGLVDGKISLETSKDGSLFSVSKLEKAGLIDQRAFSSAIARIGVVDLLKLDCEGAEWEIFQDHVAWKSVHRLVMEYHLWAKERSSVQELREVLTSLGFSRIEITEDAPSYGMAFAAR